MRPYTRTLGAVISVVTLSTGAASAADLPAIVSSFGQFLRSTPFPAAGGSIFASEAGKAFSENPDLILALGRLSQSGVPSDVLQRMPELGLVARNGKIIAEGQEGAWPTFKAAVDADLTSPKVRNATVSDVLNKPSEIWGTNVAIPGRYAGYRFDATGAANLLVRDLKGEPWATLGGIDKAPSLAEGTRIDVTGRVRIDPATNRPYLVATGHPTQPFPVADVGAISAGELVRPGQRVQMMGTFKGWAPDAATTPAQTSDWLMADKSGATIYVSGPRPNLEVGQPVTVFGEVSVTQSGQVFLDATQPGTEIAPGSVAFGSAVARASDTSAHTWALPRGSESSSGVGTKH